MLNQLSLSPIRGQLEPYDKNSPDGWRYLQCTDTVGQFKVLLPPKTAAMYDQILSMEALELSRKNSVNWERVLAIRHLKDRMIRKCQRISSTTPLKIGDAFTFQAVVAPVEFRLKEMEKWLYTQNHAMPKSMAVARQPSVSSPAKSRTQPCCARCSSKEQTSPSRRSGHSVSAKSLQTELKRAVAEVSKYSHPELNSIDQDSSPLPSTASSDRAISPLPVPVPPPGMSSMDAPNLAAFEEDEPRLHRKRSCIRRSSSGDQVKVVSWADDHNWQGVAHQDLANKWEQAERSYAAEVSKLDKLSLQVEQSLERLRSETEHFKGLEADIQVQREELRLLFENMNDKRMQFLEQAEAAGAEGTHPDVIPPEPEKEPERDDITTH
ncbi:hypothetical protein C8J56DRAFT_918864 [Mycena floridula]|nr:hypothetical protein C8J56DRAFT_918864 [Mycena floridula]